MRRVLKVLKVNTSVVNLDRYNLLIPLSHKALLELRRVLFRRGIKPKEFLTIILECVADHDSNLEYFYDLAKERQLQKIEKGEGGNIVIETFYDIFERKFKESNNKDSNDEEDL